MEPKTLKRLLIISDTIYFGIMLLSIMPAMFSVMLAAGGTHYTVYIAIYSQLTFPFVLLFSILVPWIFYYLKMPKVAISILALPVINIVLILVYVIIPEMLA